MRTGLRTGLRTRPAHTGLSLLTHDFVNRPFAVNQLGNLMAGNQRSAGNRRVNRRTVNRPPAVTAPVTASCFSAHFRANLRANLCGANRGFAGNSLETFGNLQFPC